MDTLRTVASLLTIIVFLTVGQGSLWADAETESADALFQKAKSLHQEGKFDASLKLLDQSLAKNDKDHDVWIWKAYILGKLGRSSDELACWRECTERFPDNPSIWRYQGAALSRNKQYGKALTSFERAITMAPQDGENYCSRGDCYFLMGCYDKALSDFKTAEQNGYSDKTMKTEMFWLKRIFRQLKGIDLPPKDWKAPHDSYSRIVEGTQFPEGSYVVNFLPEGGIAQKFGFKGTEEKPWAFAPAFYVWDGAWFYDHEKGALLDNGTKCKYVKIDGNQIVTQVGQIKEWKFGVERETKTAAVGKETRIPERFHGTWFEAPKGAKLIISKDKIVWLKNVFGEKREETHDTKTVKVSPDGQILSFTSKHVYSRDVFFPKAEHSAPVEVTLRLEDALLRVTVGEMRIEEQPGVIVSRPGSTHTYKLSGDAAS